MCEYILTELDFHEVFIKSNLKMKVSSDSVNYAFKEMNIKSHISFFFVTLGLKKFGFYEANFPGP